jgi:hypothetical protein
MGWRLRTSAQMYSGMSAVADDIVALAIDSGCCNRITNVHVEIDEVEDGLEHRR